MWRTAALMGLLAGAAACGDGVDAATDDPVIRAAAIESSTTTLAPATTAAPATTTTAPPEPTTTAAPTSTTTPHPRRVVKAQPFVPFATVGPVTLHHPSDRVEAIGFHQSGHDGAQQMTAASTAARPFVMESRDRDTNATGAADIVVQPGAELRSPVTGTVIRGGRYTLYCDHSDEFLVIEPDGRPGWEVKLLHFEGLMVGRGQRVEAGVTPVGTTARILPFESQVDEFTAEPSWPHVHVEVVDPQVPDRPSPGGGCN